MKYRGLWTNQIRGNCNFYDYCCYFVVIIGFYCGSSNFQYSLQNHSIKTDTMFLTCEKYREAYQRLIRLFLHVKKNVPVFPPLHPYPAKNVRRVPYRNAVDNGCCATVSYILDLQSLTQTSSVLVNENGFLTFLLNTFICRKSEQNIIWFRNSWRL